MSNGQNDPLLRAEWNRKNMKNISVSVHQRTEKELLDWILSKPNRSDYIKGLIIADMKKSQKQDVANLPHPTENEKEV